MTPTVSRKQLHVLKALQRYPDGVTARRLADDMEAPDPHTRRYSYAAVVDKLRRCVPKGLVFEEGPRGERTWKLTDDGRRVASG